MTMIDHDFIDKKALSERDICTKFITPAITTVAGWTLMQFSEELTLGKIFVKGKRVARGSKDRADYILFHNRDYPLAIIEAKDNHHDLGAGMQQALRYAEMIDVPFAYSNITFAMKSDDVQRQLIASSGATVQQAIYIRDT